MTTPRYHTEPRRAPGRGAARAAERQQQARQRLEAARGTVAVPASQAPVKPPAKPVKGNWVLNLADAWMAKHCHMTDAARHMCVLYTAAQHFRLPDESRRLAWPRFG